METQEVGFMWFLSRKFWSWFKFKLNFIFYTLSEEINRMLKVFLQKYTAIMIVWF